MSQYRNPYYPGGAPSGGYRGGHYYPGPSTHSYQPQYQYQPQQYQQQQYQQQPPPPPQQQRAARAPAAGTTDRNYLWAVFQRVDANNNGEIDSAELQNALTNGTWTPFNPETVRLMIGLFDKDNSGTINFNEFEALWKYISDWQATFARFDTDRSGSIDKAELQRCLSAFGYRLSDRFYDSTMTRFDRTRAGHLNFDDFVQLCVLLQTLTATFREKDRRRKGKIEVSYEDFLTMVFNARL